MWNNIFKILTTIFFIQLIGVVISFLLLFFSVNKDSDRSEEAYYEKSNK